MVLGVGSALPTHWQEIALPGPGPPSPSPSSVLSGCSAEAGETQALLGICGHFPSRLLTLKACAETKDHLNSFG